MDKKILGLIYSILLGLILTYAFVVRLFPMRLCDVYWDEAVYLLNAKALNNEFAGYQELSYRPPLLPFLFSLGFKITHDLWLPHLIVALLATASIFVKGSIHIFYQRPARF